MPEREPFPLKKAIKAFLPYGVVRLLQKRKSPSPPAFIPDYYLVGSHASGLISFPYYLNLLGLPAGWGAHGETMPYTERPVAARGIVIDRLFAHPAFPQKNQHIFLLVRDPVEMMCTYMNVVIAESFVITRDRHICFDQLFERNKLPMHVFIDEKSSCNCLFTTRIKNIHASCPVTIIDTKEISGDKCIKTMSNIARLFNVPMSDRIEAASKTAFGAIKNRPWAHFRPIKYRNKDSNTIYDLICCPTELYGCYYNNYYTSQAIDSFTFDGVDYTVAILCKKINREQELDISLLEKYNRKHLCRLIDNFTKYIEIYSTYCLDNYISKEEIVDFIKSNPSVYDRLMSVFEKEFSIVEKLAPEKMEQWQYYRMLCR